MNIIILAAGSSNSNQSYPICLTEFENIPILQRIIESCDQLDPSNIIATFRKSDVETNFLNNILKLLYQNSTSVSVQDNAEGAACSALLASSLVDENLELLIVAANEYLDLDYKMVINQFRRNKFDAGTVVFTSVHPRYSYVKLNEDNLVIEAKEKIPISMNATAGFYWFSKGSLFVNAAKSMIKKDARVNEKFYVCPVFNELVLDGYKIGVYKIENSNYHPLKSTHQIDLFESLMDKNEKHNDKTF